MKSALRAVALGAVAGMGLITGGHATPLQLTLTATDLNTEAVYSTTFSDVPYSTDTVTAASSPNMISISRGVQGDITFSGELATATIGASFNSLVTDALSVVNNSGTDTYMLTAGFSGMNFVGPSNRVSLTGGGTWLGTGGSVMNLAFYNDPSNTLGASTATDAPGNLVGSFTSPAAHPVTSSFSYSPGTTLLAIPDPGDFSMTETWNYILAPGGSLVSRGQTETDIYNAPEPASVMLLGAAMAGVGLARRRRSRLTGS